MSRLIDADALMRCIPAEEIISRMAVASATTIEPEVQLSPIEQALHGLSPEKQAEFLINLMRGTLAYIDSRAALIKWLERGYWNGKTD